MRIAKKIVLYIGGGAVAVTLLAIFLLAYFLNSLLANLDEESYKELLPHFHYFLKTLSASESQSVGMAFDHLRYECRGLDRAVSRRTTPQQRQELLDQRVNSTEYADYAFYVDPNGQLLASAKDLDSKLSKQELKSAIEAIQQEFSHLKPECEFAIHPLSPQGLGQLGQAFVIACNPKENDKHGKSISGFIVRASVLAEILNQSTENQLREISGVLTESGRYVALSGEPSVVLPYLKATPHKPAELLRTGTDRINLETNTPILYTLTHEDLTPISRTGALTSISSDFDSLPPLYYQKVLLQTNSSGKTSLRQFAVSKFNDFFFSLVLVAILGLLAFLVQLAYFSRMIVTPIEKAVAFSNALSKGDFSCELPKCHSNDEIAELVKSLSYMRDRLQNSITKLQNSHRREKVARKEAESANLLKSEFLANMSKELRNPLNSILGLSSLMLREATAKHSDPESVRKIKAVHKSAESLNHLVSNLLELSKLDSQDVELDVSEFNTADFLSALIELNQEAARAKNIAIEHHYAAETPDTLVTDKDILFHVLNDLLATLIEATPEHGTISFGCSSTSNQMSFWLRDQRVEDEDMPSIAETFNRYLRMTGEQFPFLGSSLLNLTIAKANAGLLGAEFIAEKTRDANSSFQLIFNREDIALLTDTETSAFHTATNKPLAMTDSRTASSKSHPRLERELAETAEPADSEVPEEPVADNMVIKSKQVLMAEDNDANRMLVELMLKKTEFALESVPDGVVCLQALEKKEYDLLLLDLQMPHLDGLGVLEAVRADKKLGGLPILLLTAYLEEQEREKLLDAGIDECIIKPINVDELLSAMRRLVE